MKTQKPEPNLSSLFPETAPDVVSEDLPVGLIDGPLLGSDPSPDLVESIKTVGVLVPIIVQRLKAGAEVYYIVGGRRRLKAARAAGLQVIPCRVLPPDVENPEAFTLSENFSRSTNPVSEYVAILELIGRGYTRQQITKTLGVKASVLDQRLQLGRLVPTLLGLLETGKIKASVGEAAAKLPEAIQKELLKTFEKANDRLTLKDVAEAKRVRREKTSASLGDVLFGGGEKKRVDVQAALSHLDAAETLLKALGEEVDFESLRARLSALAV